MRPSAKHAKGFHLPAFADRLGGYARLGFVGADSQVGAGLFSDSDRATEMVVSDGAQFNAPRDLEPFAGASHVDAVTAAEWQESCRPGMHLATLISGGFRAASFAASED